MYAPAGVHHGRQARRAGFSTATVEKPALDVLVREVVEPRWPAFRLGPPTMDGLTRRRGNGLVRLLHVGGAPVVVAVSGTVFAARAATEAAAREGIARMRFATGIDDDLEDFHARFRDDPLLGRAIRARPWLRVRRNPDPFEALTWAITEQLIELVRAKEIQRRLIAAHGPRYGALRDAPDAATVAALAPAEIDACGLAPKRTRALRLAAREVAAGRVELGRRPSAARHPRDRDVDGRVPRPVRARAARRRARGRPGLSQARRAALDGQPARHRRRGRGARVLLRLRAVRGHGGAVPQRSREDSPSPSPGRNSLVSGLASEGGRVSRFSARIQRS